MPRSGACRNSIACMRAAKPENVVSARPRYAALDAFRGIAIAGMILVNSPGSWDHVYAPLRHAEWHGCTPTDLVFPFFLFVSGASMAFAMPARVVRIARRVVVLIALGLFLNWFGIWSHWSELRLPGVLQRIALAYGVAALFVMSCTQGQRRFLTVSLLLTYWALLVLAGGDDPFALDSNIVRKVDLAVLGAAHMWNIDGVAFDPEGLLSTVPAVTSVIIGYETMQWLKRHGDRHAYIRLLGVGVLLSAAGLLWNLMLPINKSLWTPSYVVFTSGICLMLLAALIWIVDERGLRRLAKPFEIYGTNPLFVYALSWVFARSIALLVFVPGTDGGQISLHEWLYAQSSRVASPIDASLLFALLQVLLFLGVSWLLYRKRIYIRL